MVIMHLIHNFKREGAQVVVRNLSLSIANSDNKVVVCAWNEAGGLERDLQGSNVDFISPPDNVKSSKIKLVKYLLSVINRQSVTIIHAHMSDSAVIASCISMLSGVPFVITHHSNRILPDISKAKKIIRRILLKYSCQRAKKNIGVAESVKCQLQADLHLDGAQIEVVNNGVLMPDVKPSENEEQLNGPKIISVGRLIKIKGQRQLLLSMPQIIKHFPNATLTLVGDGPLASEYQQIAAETGLLNHIKFAGSVDNVVEYLHSADIFVSSSEYEGQPMALLEAMGASVPVIATAVAGNLDVIKDRENGLLYEYFDREQLLENIKTVTSSADFRKKIGENGRLAVLEQYSSDIMASKYIDIYSEALGT